MQVLRWVDWICNQTPLTFLGRIFYSFGIVVNEMLAMFLENSTFKIFLTVSDLLVLFCSVLS
jgi:hypothetical protein